MVTTQSADFMHIAQSLRDHGASRTDLARHTGKAGFLLAEYNLLGYNYRMTDIQGAMGSVQMDRAQWILAQRTACAAYYDQALATTAWLTTPLTPAGYVHGYQAYVCLFRPEEPSLQNVLRLHEQRNTLMLTLEALGIATRQGTHAPIIQGYYVDKYGFRPEQFPNAYLADRLTLALPLYAQMVEADRQRVVTELQTQFAQMR